MAKLEVLYQAPIAKYKIVAIVENLQQAKEELEKTDYKVGYFVSDSERIKIIVPNKCVQTPEK